MRIIKLQTMTWVALAVSMMAGCSNDDGIVNNNYPEDNVVRIMASVDEARTRSYTTETLNSFYLSIHNPVNEKYNYGVVYIGKKDGVWQNTDGHILLWQNAEQPVDIVAYNYLNESSASPVYEETRGKACVWENQSFIDGSGESRFTASDFLIYKKENFVPGTDLVDKKLNITFQHGFSLLNIDIELGTEYNYDSKFNGNPPYNTISVEGIALGAYIDFTQTPIQISADPETKGSITPCRLGYIMGLNKDEHTVDHYACIIVPQTIKAGDFKVNLKVDGINYSWASSTDITLEGGKKYQLKLNFGKEAVVAGGFTSEAWNDMEGGKLETK